MKLLNRTVRYYLIYAGIVLLVAIPILYFIIQSIVKEDVDESLMAHKEQVVKKMNQATQQIQLNSAETMEADLTISSSGNVLPHDSLYTITAYDTISKENIPYRVLESNVLIKNTPYFLRLKNSLLDSRDLIETIVLVMTLLLLFIIAGLMVITRAISKKIWKPFYTTVDKLHQYRVDKDEVHLFENTPVDEFTDLNKTITALLQRNRQAYQSQKEFTENASHEMQTPLAVFQSKVELLMQTTPLTSDQAELITELSEAGQRMNRLNKTLLLLSKIENNQFTDKEPVNIDNSVQKLAEQYKNALNQKNLSLHTRVAGEPVISANQTLIEILIGNLLSNAIRHNVQGGKINIIIEPNQFNISNTGNTKPLDASRLFHRFQKQTVDANSVGLGLEIAKRICNLYKADITYNYADSLHSFNVSFNNS